MRKIALIISIVLTSFLFKDVGRAFQASSLKFTAVGLDYNKKRVNAAFAGTANLLNYLSKGGAGLQHVNPKIKGSTAGAAITAGTVTGNITACAGTPSASPNIQQVSVSGTGLSADIKAVVPVNFEISLTPGGGYAGSVILTQGGGVVNNKIVYVRSSATAAAGTITGALILSSAGANDRNLLVYGVINAPPTANKPADQTKTNGEATDAVNFAGTGKYFTWTNDKPSIGLPAGGTGDIASFTAVNNTAADVKATITVTPHPAGMAYIANYGADNVSVINTADNKVIKTIPVGSNPYSVTASKDGTRVYVVNSISNDVSVINTATNTVIGAAIGVGLNPLGAVVSDDGTRLYVVNKGSKSISIIDPIAAGNIKDIPLSQVPYGIAISKDGNTLFVTNYEANSVSVVDVATGNISDIAVKPGPFGIVMSADGSKVYLTNELDDKISVIDVATQIVTAALPVGQTPYGIAVSPDGSRIYVSCAVENKIKVIDAATKLIIGTTNTGDFPYGVSVSDDGSKVYVANVNSSDVTVINMVDNSVITKANVGHNPYSLGNFVAKGSDCSGEPVSFTITVTTVKAVITAGNVTGNIAACLGAASASPNIQQFPVSGSKLTASLTATAPAGFEISLTPGSGYGSTLSIAQSGGLVDNKTIYVRSAASATGMISGNVVLSSVGATDVQVAVKGIINQLPTVASVPNQVKTNGDLTDAINFGGTGPIFTWVNDNPQIGLAANGTGNIAPFKAINNTTNDITANITVLPQSVGYAYVANVRGSITVMNAVTDEIVETIPAGLGSEPDQIVFSADGSRAYITNINSNTISVINTLTNKIIQYIPVPEGPTGIAISPDNKTLYVGITGNNTIVAVNLTTNLVSAVLNVGAKCHRLVISPDGTKLYAIKYSDKVIAIDIPSFSITEEITAGAGPNNLVMSPDGKQLYVVSGASSDVSVINTATNKVTSTIKTGVLSNDIAMSPDGSRLYVTNFNESTISVINPALDPAHAVINVIPVEYTPNVLAVSSDGNKLYVSHAQTSDITIIDTKTLQISPNNPVIDDGPLSIKFTPGAGCVGEPITFKITVKPNASVPTIVSNGALAPLTSTYSKASAASTSFNVAGTNLTTGILVTAPPGFELSINNLSFSHTITVGAAGTVSATMVYVRLAPLTNAGTYSGDILFTSAGAADVKVPTVLSTVNRAALTVSAIDSHKNFGTTIYGAAGALSFTTDGLQNTETVGSVTIAFGAGALASDPPAVYPKSITITDATGGTFNPDNYMITYLPASLTVDALPAPVFTLNNTPQSVNTTYGSPSGFTSFFVAGSQMQGAILITPPVGFEVSTDNVTYSNTVQFGTAGFIPQTQVYIRLKATTPVQTYNGMVQISSVGATGLTEFIPNSTVAPAHLTITPLNITKTYGDNLVAGAGSTGFSSTGLKNGEAVGSITIAYLAGSATTDHVGTYQGTVAASAATGGTFNATNYTINYVNADITVNKAILTITAVNSTRKYGDQNPVLEEAYNGFKNGEDASVLTTRPVINTTATILSQPGSYPITVSGATAINYDINYVNGTLSVIPLSVAIAVPNAFSPNGDGQNDTWDIKNIQNYPNNTVDVFNRYGQKLYSSIGYSTPWDGRYNGSTLPYGTYYYIVNPKNGSSVISGFVTIIK